jgi:toxin CptA
LGRSRFLGVLLLGLWLCGLLLVLALVFSKGPAADWRIALALACVLGAGAAAYAGWRNAPAGQLAWDGEVWRWESPGYQAGVAEYGLSVLADFQHALLLRLENQAHAVCGSGWSGAPCPSAGWTCAGRFIRRTIACRPWAHDSLRMDGAPAVAVSGAMHPQ